MFRPFDKESDYVIISHQINTVENEMDQNLTAAEATAQEEADAEMYWAQYHDGSDWDA
jgi:hypothetical protein